MWAGMGQASFKCDLTFFGSRREGPKATPSGPLRRRATATFRGCELSPAAFAASPRENRPVQEVSARRCLPRMAGLTEGDE